MKGPYYNYLATGKHAYLPHEPPITAVDEAAIQYEYGQRLRTLLSVDDLIRGVHHYLVEVGEWERTFFLFTSDHGYNLGRSKSPLAIYNLLEDTDGLQSISGLSMR